MIAYLSKKQSAYQKSCSLIVIGYYFKRNANYNLLLPQKAHDLQLKERQLYLLWPVSPVHSIMRLRHPSMYISHHGTICAASLLWNGAHLLLNLYPHSWILLLLLLFWAYVRIRIRFICQVQLQVLGMCYMSPMLTKSSALTRFIILQYMINSMTSSFCNDHFLFRLGLFFLLLGRHLLVDPAPLSPNLVPLLTSASHFWSQWNRGMTSSSLFVFVFSYLPFQWPRHRVAWPKALRRYVHTSCILSRQYVTQLSWCLRPKTLTAIT